MTSRYAARAPSTSPSLRLQDLAEPVLELEHFVRRLGDLGLAREDVGELRPALGLRVEAIESADGA